MKVPAECLVRANSGEPLGLSLTSHVIVPPLAIYPLRSMVRSLSKSPWCVADIETAYYIAFTLRNLSQVLFPDVVGDLVTV